MGIGTFGSFTQARLAIYAAQTGIARACRPQHKILHQFFVGILRKQRRLRRIGNCSVFFDFHDICKVIRLRSIRPAVHLPAAATASAEHKCQRQNQYCRRRFSPSVHTVPPL